MSKHEHAHDHTCLVSVPIFNHLELEELTKITNLIHSKRYQKGELIFSYGQKSDTLYILRKGQIKTYYLSENAKEHILRILYPGDFIGELSIFLDEDNTAYAEAMTHVELCTIKKEDISKLMTDYPNIGMKIINELSQRLKRSEKQSSWIATEQVEKRIALYLLEFYDKNNPNLSIHLNMTKKDLASFLGTTPETLSRKLAQLEDQGFIYQVSNKEIKINNYDGLINFMNEL
ncbi:MAG TPA: Crp/Fnr family transcriptional regulator [Acholeplasmataceae bacterium]|nr:Crp/Fnr family transcriptional regulator [Acholeplasmataceae bacterium]